MSISASKVTIRNAAEEFKPLRQRAHYTQGPLRASSLAGLEPAPLCLAAVQPKSLGHRPLYLRRVVGPVTEPSVPVFFDLHFSFELQLQL